MFFEPGVRSGSRNRWQLPLAPPNNVWEQTSGRILWRLPVEQPENFLGFSVWSGSRGRWQLYFGPPKDVLAGRKHPVGFDGDYLSSNRRTSWGLVLGRVRGVDGNYLSEVRHRVGLFSRRARFVLHQLCATPEMGAKVTSQSHLGLNTTREKNKNIYNFEIESASS